MSVNNNTSNTSKVVKGLSSQTIVTIVLGVVEIASFSIMSRLLTQEDFGYYAAINAITLIFYSFSETGIGSAIVQKKNLNQRFIDNSFTLSLLIGLFISILLLVLARPLARTVADESMAVPLMLTSVTLLLSCLTSVNNSLMQRKLQFIRMGLIRLFSLVITTIICVWLALKGFGYYAILTKAILTSFINYFLSLLLCKTHFGLALDKAVFKEIFSFSGWLMASVLFRNLAHQIDNLMMPRLLSVSALGSYNRPKGFVDQISDKLNGIFDTALFPVLSDIQDNRPALESAFHRSLFLMNVFSLFLTTAVAFNGDLLIRIFFGEQWLDLRPVLIAVAFTLLLNSDGRLADCFLRSLAMTRQQFYFRIFETVFRFIGVIVSYKFGVLGVAISVAITNTITKLVKIVYIGYKINIKPVKVLALLFSSWRYGILIIPVCALAYFFLPKTWGGDIGMAFLYMILIIMIFMFLPKLVGKQYEEEVYIKIKSFLFQKIHIK